MKIGLTGGIACGKSTVLKYMSDKGIESLSADAIVKRLYAEDSSIRDALTTLYSEKILSDGRVDPRLLSAEINSAPDTLPKVENIVHPRVREEWQNWLNKASEGHRMIEIPLLFEKNLEKHFDMTIAVIARRERQLTWLAERNLSKEQALHWIDRQLPNTQKAEHADYVICNDGSFEFLHAQVDKLLEQI